MSAPFRRPPQWLLLLLAVAAGCGQTSAPSSESRTVTPGEREVAVATSGCGHAAAGIGSGVLLADDLIVTAAHVVAGAEHIWIVPGPSLPEVREWPDFSPTALERHTDSRRAEVVSIDRRRDLALLTISDQPVAAMASAPAVSTVNLDGRETVTIHGVADSNVTEAIVVERTRIVADEVRGTDRVERLGYRLTAATTTGDSGAGLWHDDRLAGILFAVSADEPDVSWAVAGSEIETVLTHWRTSLDQPQYRCHDERSRMEPIGN